MCRYVIYLQRLPLLTKPRATWPFPWEAHGPKNGCQANVNAVCEFASVKEASLCASGGRSHLRLVFMFPFKPDTACVT